MGWLWGFWVGPEQAFINACTQKPPSNGPAGGIRYQIFICLPHFPRLLWKCVFGKTIGEPMSAIVWRRQPGTSNARALRPSIPSLEHLA